MFRPFAGYLILEKLYFILQLGPVTCSGLGTGPAEYHTCVAYLKPSVNSVIYKANYIAFDLTTFALGIRVEFQYSAFTRVLVAQ